MNVLWEEESPRRFAAPPFNKGALAEGANPYPLCLAVLDISP